ncbi:hypothetical protein Syun_025111 [Stephania yunnanensis]|uniref:Uncharacterized protein n=1 Tax=Stephania yunnanensis TaxID=152371 RepID=A0AAP0ERI6_9MAGN
MRRRFGLGLGMIVGPQFAVCECGGAANIALHASHYQQLQEIFSIVKGTVQARPAVTEVTHVRAEIVSPIPETPAEDTPSTPIDTGVKAIVEVRQTRKFPRQYWEKSYGGTNLEDTSCTGRINANAAEYIINSTGRRGRCLVAYYGSVDGEQSVPEED